MKADLYVCDDTFKYNGSDSVADVKRKLSDFLIMIDEIRKYKEENCLYLVKENFGKTVAFGDRKTINDIISDYESSTLLYGKDVLTLFMGIFKHCKSTQVSLNDMKEYLAMEDDKNCSAILVLNPLDGYKEHIQVLSSVGGWLKSRRHFLAKYPGDEEFFLSESEKYFPDLRIHKNTKDTLGEVLASHHEKIVTYLSVLNDFLIMEFKASGGRDFVSFLTKFAGDHQLEGASFEGTKLDKFNFIFPDGIEAYCEPHLKMFTDDSGNKNQHCRIHFKKPLENESIVYVGCICKHL